MWLNELWKRWVGRASRKVRRQRRHLRTQMRTCLRLEALEDRTLLSSPGLPYETPSNATQLIADINAANSAGGAATITLASGASFDFYQDTTGHFNDPNANNSYSALPLITNNITIVGNGDSLTAHTNLGDVLAAGTPAIRLFDVEKDGSLTLQNLTLQGGLAYSPGSEGEGGAIYSSGQLTLTSVQVLNNLARGHNGSPGNTAAVIPLQSAGNGGQAGDAYGGGLYVTGGAVTLTDDGFSGNQAVGGTGGPGGAATLFHQNPADGGNGGGGFGGGLFLGSGSLTVSGGSFNNNQAAGGGGGHGGYDFYKPGGAGGQGGAAGGGALFLVTGTATLSGVTLATNKAVGGVGGTGGVPGGGSGGSGGGAFGGALFVEVGELTIKNSASSSSIIQNNTAQGGNGANGVADYLGEGGKGGVGGSAGGGGMYVLAGTVNVSNDTGIVNNNALGGYGGAAGVGGGWTRDFVDAAEFVADLVFDPTKAGVVEAIIKAAIALTIFPDDPFSPGASGAPGSGGFAYGGGVMVAGGAVNLSSDSVSSNQAAGGEGGSGATALINFGTGAARGGAYGGDGDGGGLYVTGGTVTLNDNAINNNQAKGGTGGNQWGGVNKPVLSLHHTTAANGDGGNAAGGGLYVNAGTVILTDDTLALNQAEGGNGPATAGYFVKSLSEESTGGGVGGDANGGGIFVNSYENTGAGQAAVELLNDTIASNKAVGGVGAGWGQSSGSNFGYDGGNANAGGVFVAEGNAITLANTLIAENSVTAGTANFGSSGSAFDSDFNGTANSSDHDLIGDGSSSNFVNGLHGDLVGNYSNPIDPKLGPLQNNGGPTQTMALLSGSPAIDAGDSSAAGLSAVDQRGFARIAGNAVDIGAYESGSPATPAGADLSVSMSAISRQGFGQDITYTITVTNNSNINQSNVTLTDQIPANTSLVSWTTPNGWSSSAPAAGSSSGTVAAWAGTLDAGVSAVFTLIVQISGTTAAGSTITNTASVGPSVNDPDTTNNSASLQTTVINPSTTTISAPDVVSGDDDFITVTVTSPGGTSTGSVRLTLNNGSPITQILVNGSTTFEFPDLSLGDYTLSAIYVPASNSISGSGAAGAFSVFQLNAVDNAGELLAAIKHANKSSGPTTLTLVPGAAIDFTTADNTTNGANALPVVQSNVTVLGNGDVIQRTASNAFRFFDVAGGSSLTLQDLTLQGGLAQGTGTAADGGAIYSSGTLSLSGVTMRSNQAVGNTGSNGAGGSYGREGHAGSNGAGGGLYVAAGTANLTMDTLSNNRASGGNGGNGGNAVHSSGGLGGGGGGGAGGGVYVAGGSATLTKDTLSGNNAGGGNGGNGGIGRHGYTAGDGGSAGAGAGGAIYVGGGSIILSEDTLSGNGAMGGTGGNGGRGGQPAIQNDFTNQSMSAGNGGLGGRSSVGAGGGLFVANGSVSLTNVTLSSNQALGGNGGNGGNAYGAGSHAGAAGAGADGTGGGLDIAAGNVMLLNDTLAVNRAKGGTGGAGGSAFTYSGRAGSGGKGGNGSGGGLFVVSGSGVNLANTLIAENTVAAGAGGPKGFSGVFGAAGSAGVTSGSDASAAVASSDHDLIGDSTGFSANTSTGDILNPSYIGLAPLSNNGGPTKTMALLSGSAAIDAGDNNASGLPSTDQRGYARIFGTAVDIGAYEYQPLNVSSDVSMKRGGFRYDFVHHEFVQTITITNTSSSALVGPLALTLTNLSSNATLANASGTDANGNPYIDFATPSGELAAGQSITVTLYFTDPTFKAITYGTQVWQGF